MSSEIRPSGRAVDALRPITHHAPLHAPCRRIDADRMRRHPGDLHRQHRRESARLFERQRAGLDDCRIRHAAALHPYPHGPRSRQGQTVRTHPGNPAPDRALAARRVRSRPLSANAPAPRLRRIQADGGTRTASITGAMVAAYDAFAKLQAGRFDRRDSDQDFVAAISVGVYHGMPVLDLDYPEDSDCDTDMNIVMTGDGGICRNAGHGGRRAFTAPTMNRLLDLAPSRHRPTDRACKSKRWKLKHRRRSAKPGAQRLASPHASLHLLLANSVLASNNPGKLKEFAPNAGAARFRRSCRKPNSTCPKPKSHTPPSSKTRSPKRATPPN